MVTTILELAGLALLVVAAFLIAIPLGLAAAGGALLLTAAALEQRE